MKNAKLPSQLSTHFKIHVGFRSNRDQRKRAYRLRKYPRLPSTE
jgi:hypothetical protein